MSPQIMRAKMNSSQKARFLNHESGRCISYGKDPLLGFDSLFTDKILETIGEFLGNEKPLPGLFRFWALVNSVFGHRHPQRFI
jgi:hypothetical protein